MNRVQSIFVLRDRCQYVVLFKDSVKVCETFALLYAWVFHAYVHIYVCRVHGCVHWHTYELYFLRYGHILFVIVSLYRTSFLFAREREKERRIFVRERERQREGGRERSNRQIDRQNFFCLRETELFTREREREREREKNFCKREREREREREKVSERGETDR